jgi:predicted AAA+ superfamily ATPase
MIKREIGTILLEMAKKMPIISITGPRQSGKTTLARQCYPDHDYVNLESPETRLVASEDPKAFLNNHRKGLIIDEAQRLPELFSYLQVISDENGKAGEFIITGSQNFSLMRSLSQSLAGRVFTSHLLPFSLRELKQARQLPKNVNELIIKGFYPRLYDKEIEPTLFYPSYEQTYLERDIAGLVNPTNLNAFRKFMQLLAGRTGQLINFSSLSIEVGVDYKTIQSWCSLLETGFIIFFLKPFHKNFSKRIVKSPKVYFFDTGLACSLLNIKSSADLEKHWARGALFENMVVADRLKNFFNTGQKPPVFFWRDNKGLEIDLLIEEANRLQAIEIKSGTTLTTDYLKNIDRFRKLVGDAVDTYVVYGGDTALSQKNTTILPWYNDD